MKNKAFFFLFSLFLFGCGDKTQKWVEDAPTITTRFQDDRGKELTFAKLPKRVVSLAPNITEMVYALGVSHKLVARSAACDAPAACDSLPAIVTYPQIDMEALVAMKPDLVLLTDEIFSPEIIASLEEKGLMLYVQKYQKLSDIYKHIRGLGKLLDAEKIANHKADSLEQIEKRVWEATRNSVKYNTMILVSDDPLMGAGGIGYLDELIEKAGGKNIFRNHKKAYTQTNIEELLYLQPEYIIIPTNRQQTYAELMEKYPMLWNTIAARNKHVFQLEENMFYRPGIPTTQALLQLTNILHSQFTPEQFLGK